MKKDRPDNEPQFDMIVDHYYRIGLFEDRNYVELGAVQDYVDCEWHELASAIDNRQLEHVLIDSFNDDELPFTRWEWVDDWIERGKPHE